MVLIIISENYNSLKLVSWVPSWVIWTAEQDRGLGSCFANSSRIPKIVSEITYHVRKLAVVLMAPPTHPWWLLPLTSNVGPREQIVLPAIGGVSHTTCHWMCVECNHFLWLILREINRLWQDHEGGPWATRGERGTQYTALAGKRRGNTSCMEAEKKGEQHNNDSISWIHKVPYSRIFSRSKYFAISCPSAFRGK